MPIIGLRRSSESPSPVMKSLVTDSAQRANSDNGRDHGQPLLQASLPIREVQHQIASAPLFENSPKSGTTISRTEEQQSSEQVLKGVTNTICNETRAAKCRFLGDMCKFPTYSILLSPCIADFPWVADDLLSGHGVSEFLRDPKDWLRSRDANATSVGTSATPRTGRKTKIVLVDRRRKDATLAFLQSIEAAQLRRRNGKREYVPVYDWRVLEAIRDEERKLYTKKRKPEQQFELNHHTSIWRRFWVGLA